MRAVTAAAKSQAAYAAKEVAMLKAEIEDFEKRLAFKPSGVDRDKIAYMCPMNLPSPVGRI